ncbi:gas vesicle protein [Hoyosella sp. YIM 151337]|uniref:gas vesicle protein GvpO n=1 Tax=Hoyosella sp. YIM 151337 TaxID=2992742 RepID=UPI0022355418|nr:gas vesicle protein [Hoyosella sp. YIM 151337]MCW4351786.1 gas vesicle protein [Hoyosella sp. YIM 151337]
MATEKGASDGDSALEPLDAAQVAARNLAQLTGKEPQAVTSLAPTDEGWEVEVEVIEDHRVPSSADILALYEVQLDQEGTLLSWRRTKRYMRGRGDEAQ